MPSVRWTTLAGWAAVIAAVLALLWALGGLVQVLLVAALLAYLLDPLVTRVERLGAERTRAAALVFAGASVVVAAAIVVGLPPLVAQLRALEAGFSADHVAALLGDVETYLAAHFGAVVPDDLALTERVQAFVAAHAGDVVLAVPGALGLLVDLALIPFVLFFLLKDGPALRHRLIGAVPNRYFELALTLCHKVDGQLGGYLRGQFVAALVVAVQATAVLWLLGVPYFVLIGLVAGLTNMIPYVGPVVGGALATVVTLATGGGGQQALLVAGAFALIQVVDNAVVQPLVLARHVALHPLLILLSVFVGGRLFGPLGLLLAVPAAAALKVVVVETVRTLRHYRRPAGSPDVAWSGQR